MNQKDYAAHRGVAQSAVSKEIKNGKIHREKNGLLDPEKCDALWPLRPEQIARRDARESAAPAPAPRPPARHEANPRYTRRADADGDYSDAAMIRLNFQIKQADLDGKEMANRRKRGELISRRVAEIVLAGAAQVARQRIMAVPLAVSHLCANAKQTEIVEIMTRALERAFADTLARPPDFVAADTDFAGDSDG